VAFCRCAVPGMFFRRVDAVACATGDDEGNCFC
jgi:hypothetical protein